MINKEELFMSNKEIIIARLEKFISTGKVVVPYQGLCHFITSCQNNLIHELTITDLHKIFLSWEYFSGDEVYPIKSPWYSLLSTEGYYIHDNLYKGRQLKMRKLLARHIINELSKEVSNDC